VLSTPSDPRYGIRAREPRRAQLCIIENLCMTCFNRMARRMLLAQHWYSKRDYVHHAPHANPNQHYAGTSGRTPRTFVPTATLHATHNSTPSNTLRAPASMPSSQSAQTRSPPKTALSTSIPTQDDEILLTCDSEQAGGSPPGAPRSGCFREEVTAPPRPIPSRRTSSSILPTKP
jgi:hypothetical protein